MREYKFSVLIFSFSVLAVAQSDRGTITGTVSDPAGAVIASAGVEVRNTQTGAVYQVASSETGNYVVQVPTGTYEVSIAVQGFKKYVRPNILVPVEQTLRIDATLEIGSTGESVTVNEAAPLLKTESGELAHNVTAESLNTLPILGIGTAAVGSTGIRSVFAVTTMVLAAVEWRRPPLPSPASKPSRRLRFRPATMRRSSGRLAGVCLTSP